MTDCRNLVFSGSSPIIACNQMIPLGRVYLCRDRGEAKTGEKPDFMRLRPKIGEKLLQV